jgi:iron complex transport system substrate-binding protein
MSGSRRGASRRLSHPRPRSRLRHCFAVIFALQLSPALAQAAPPQRIVSLNVCTDQILIDLVPRTRIAAVTHLAADPLSAAHPENARGIASTKGAAEDVLARDPDLVIAGAYTTPATVALLRRVGRRVEVVAQPQTIAGIRDLIRDIARVVEEPAVGDALVAAMDARLERVRAAPALIKRPTAIVYQVNNYVSASGSLIDEALALAGFQNGAGRLSFARNGQVGLEALLMAPPDLLILASGPATYRTAVADNLRHPALRNLAAQVPSTVVPWPLWLCGTHHIADAVERLAALRR